MKSLLLIGLLVVVVAATPLKDRLATIDQRYIVVFNDDVDVDALVKNLEVGAASLSGEFDVTRRYYSALRGMAVKLDEKALQMVIAAPGVKYVEKDAIAVLHVAPTSWGLDRTDQRDLPLDQDFTIQGDGSGATVYVLDTGIRETHEDFGGRAVKAPVDFVEDGWNGADCHGHGTHCAGTAAGGIHGIARAANIIAIRIFDCRGFGTSADIIASIDYMTTNVQLPAVASMSFGVARRAAVDDAVTAATNRGIVMVASAGNSDNDACTFSPAGSPTSITVAASNEYDERAYFSSYGTCVELFAPGLAITSASPASDTATAIWSGTSMSGPHVAGAVAVHLSNGVPASDIADRLIADSSKNKIYDTGAETPNRLLYLA